MVLKNTFGKFLPPEARKATKRSTGNEIHGRPQTRTKANSKIGTTFPTDIFIIQQKCKVQYNLFPWPFAGVRKEPDSSSGMLVVHLGRNPSIYRLISSVGRTWSGRRWSLGSVNNGLSIQLSACCLLDTQEASRTTVTALSGRGDNLKGGRPIRRLESVRKVVLRPSRLLSHRAICCAFVSCLVSSPTETDYELKGRDQNCRKEIVSNSCPVAAHRRLQLYCKLKLL